MWQSCVSCSCGCATRRQLTVLCGPPTQRRGEGWSVWIGWLAGCGAGGVALFDMLTAKLWDRLGKCYFDVSCHGFCLVSSPTWFPGPLLQLTLELPAPTSNDQFPFRFGYWQLSVCLCILFLLLFFFFWFVCCAPLIKQKTGKGGVPTPTWWLPGIIYAGPTEWSTDLPMDVDGTLTGNPKRKFA